MNGMTITKEHRVKQRLLGARFYHVVKSAIEGRRGGCFVVVVGATTLGTFGWRIVTAAAPTFAAAPSVSAYAGRSLEFLNTCTLDQKAVYRFRAS